MNPINDITIYNPYGSAYISDGGSSTLFPISNSCERTAKVMGEDSVRLVFTLTHKVTFDAFSFIEYNGQAFFLKEQYIPKPIGGKEVGGVVQSARYSYDVKFVSVGNMLDKFICYRHVVVGDNSWNEPEININGTLETLYVIIMGAIQQAASRLDPAMFFTAVLSSIATNGLTTSGGVIVPNTSVIRLTQGTELLTFNFSGDNIANVCTTVANNFTNDDKKDTEWYITPVDMATFNTCALHFAKCVDEDGGSVRIMTDYVVERDGEYLDGKLKSVEYTQAWSGIPEVIVPYGSDRNMSYYSVKAIDEVTRMQSTFGKRLRLKPNKVGTDAYQFTDKDGNPVSIETDANGAMRNRFVNTGIEVVKIFDEIYPQCHFKVTSVAEKSKRQDGQIVPEYTIEAEPIDRDGNPLNREDLTNNGFYPIQIEEATTLSVRFESGLLNGREFEIANKTRKDDGATTYSLKFIIVADGSIEDGTLIPSGNFKPRAEGNGYEGDKFALFNMKMPEEYVTYAELELAKRAYEELIELQSSRPEIKCVTDDTVFNEDIKLGDVIIVRSELFNSADVFKSRVISYSYKLTQPREVTFNLASAIMQGTLSSMNDLIADVTHTAGGLEQRAINLSRRGWRDASEVASMLDSLTADVVLVGNGRYQFGYAHEGQGVEVVHSTVGDETRTTAIKISHGTIEHTQEPYVDWVSKGFWEVSGETKTTATTKDGEKALTDIPDTPLYLYAVVNESDTLLVTELTSIAHDADEDEGYLLMGILSSEFEGRRVFSRTNGYTSIEGGTITTEIIQDAGRNLIIDFQSNPPRILARGKAKIQGNIEFELTEEQIAEIAGSVGSDYGYLKEALQQSTRITGGLVSTSVIELQDGGVTTAGISGLNNDGILLWGGATYSEACNAAKEGNDYYTQPGKGDRQITTLIRKDGTGKIGIFKISKTQAVVDVQGQGSVLIDASSRGGIYVRNSNGENKISIKNGEIGNDFIPEEYTETGKKSFSFSNVLCSGSSGTCSTQRSADLWEDMVKTYSNGTNTVTVKFVNMSFRQMLRYFGATPTANTTAKVILYAKTGGGGYSAVATKTLTLENVTSGSNYVSELTYQNFTLTHTSSNAYTYILSVEVNGKDHYACLGDFMMQGDVEWSWHYVESSTPQTIIGTDGIATIYNNNAYFMVKNTSTGQKVYAKGLSTNKGVTAGNGELYISNANNDGMVKTLKAALNAISTALQNARYIGDNSSYQSDAKTAIDSAITALNKISIVAST